MAPIIMMKLKLVAVAFGVAQAATKICAKDGDFDGTRSPGADAPAGACAAFQTIMPAFTATAQSCAADMTWSGKQLRASVVMGIVGACCKTGVHVCSAFVAQAATKICADDGDFDGTAGALAGDTCAVYQTMLPAFTATAQSCAANMTLPGQQVPVPASEVMGLAGACCKTGVHVCSQYNLNPCATASDFQPNLDVTNAKKEKQKCLQLAAFASSMTPSAGSCAVKTKVGDSMFPVSYVASMAAALGCCKQGKGACEQFVATPCADRTKFMPKNKMGSATDGMSCAVAVGAMMGAPFVADKATCAVSITVDGKAKTRTAATADVAQFCCSDKVSACAAATDTKVTGSQTSGSATAVLGGAIALLVVSAQSV